MWATPQPEGADARRGRVLLCFDEGEEELDGVVCAAMARVPKMLPDRTVSSKGRVIWDAKPINDKAQHSPPCNRNMMRLLG